MTEVDEPLPLKPGVNLKHGERFLRGEDLEPVLRDPLAIAMLAAWLNVRPDQVPAAFKAFTCEHTMKAWKRVGEAAITHLQAAAEIDFEIWQDDMLVASSTDEADARHYAAVYAQDGPVQLFRVETRRTPLEV